MESLQRRRSGVYVARLAIPRRIQNIVDRAEFISGTGTSRLRAPQ